MLFSVPFMQNKLILLYTELALEDSSFWQNVKRATDIKIRDVCVCVCLHLCLHMTKVKTVDFI